MSDDVVFTIDIPNRPSKVIVHRSGKDGVEVYELKDGRRLPVEPEDLKNPFDFSDEEKTDA